MLNKWIVGISAMALLAGPADAARTFNFSYLLVHGALIYGNVNFTTDDVVHDVGGRNALRVTGIRGDEGGVAITGLVPSFPQQFGGADNYLFPDEWAPFSALGISFSFANGRYANFYYNEDDPFYGLYKFAADDLAGEVEADSLKIFNPTFDETTAAVPEPASWALMVGGFGAVGGTLRSRRKTAVRLQSRLPA